MPARILVIDDDQILAGLLQLTLELEGYDVAVEYDGNAGLQRVLTERFDLVLLDLVMPKVDGIKFLRLLAERGAKRPPIMIVSSAIDEGMTDDYRAMGVVDIARKPVEPAALVARASAILATAEAG